MLNTLYGYENTAAIIIFLIGSFLVCFEFSLFSIL